MMTSEVWYLIGVIAVFAVWQSGCGAGVAALAFIHRTHLRARDRILLACVIAGLIPAAIYALSTIVGPMMGLEAALGGAIALAVGAAAAFPGAFYVTRRLDRGRNPASIFE